MDKKKNAALLDKETFTMLDWTFICLMQWKWFVLSLVVCISVAAWRIVTTTPVYMSGVSILINDNQAQKGSASHEQSLFAEMGVFRVSTNINNELKSIQSLSVITEVVKRMHLNMDYQTDGRFHRIPLYGEDLPVTATVEGIDENASCSWTMDVRANGEVDIHDLKYNGHSEEGLSHHFKGRIGDNIATPVGNILVTPTAYYKAGSDCPRIYVECRGLLASVGKCSNSLSVKLDDEENTILNLTYKDCSVKRAEDVLTTIVDVYNENWVKTKNQVAISTSKFIDERLIVIEKELGNVDSDIASYKSANRILDVHAAASMYMTKANTAETRIADLNNQLYMAKYIRDYLKSEVAGDQLLPANSGVGSAVIENQIAAYNTKLLERNTLVSNSSERNPLVKEIDKTLLSMRASLLTSVDNQINALSKQLSTSSAEEAKSTTHIASSPTQAKYLLSVERQQKVKEALYLFLLQKREENELSQAFTAYNTQMINPPYSIGKVAPADRQILMYALVVGFAIPIAIIVLMEITNTRVRGRKDIENLSIPFVGEIPMVLPKKTGFSFKKKKPEKLRFVVSKGNRNLINEAFRVLRTNFEFVTESGVKSKVVIVTSFNPASGKSFITMNMAVSLALTDKRVLVIDGDLRHASASAYVKSPRRGLSDHLSGRIANVEDVIVAVPDYDNVHIIPVGTVPPNPS